MAIYHLSVKPVSRSSGRSAVAAVAYRVAERLENRRDGMVHDFSRRTGVEHAEIVLPGGVDAAWAKDRGALWNAAEGAEKRRDARVAREIEVALPHELTAEQRLALVRGFAQGLAERYGVAVDFAIHSPHAPSDERNHHAHLMLTTRKVGPEGLGEKSELELENRKLQVLGLPSSHEQVREIRALWAERANAELARAGLEERIDARSHAERGIGIAPTEHMGVQATQMERRGQAVTRLRLDEAAGRRNAELIRAEPEQVLSLITGEKSVFDRRDIARALHRAIEEGEGFQGALAAVMASPALVELQPERRDGSGRVIEAARYSTQEMVAVEREMAQAAARLAEGRSHGVAGSRVSAVLAARPMLSGEQRAAVEHVTGPERMAAVVGLAGSGKSTMLAAAREAWEGAGYRVWGAALAGKAAEGLEEASGIASRTLASWERSWERGFDRLGRGDVVVIDEAGMVGSRPLARMIAEAERVGAKLVVVGDPEQLQPIGPGAAFRAVAERVGWVELEEVRRQGEGWQRAASVAFGRHRTAEGLAAYAGRDAIRFEETGDAARAAIVGAVVADMTARPEGSRLVLAHRRAEVQALNQAIRAARQERGELAGERVYRTTEGERVFAVGDRVLFRENDRGLGVKNGMLGTVAEVEEGRLAVRLDAAEGSGRVVAVAMAEYGAVDHGYALTIHKAQGATVDRAYVLASGGMDRHLTYVAMTRHRDGVVLYAGRDEFGDVGALTARLSRSGAKETTLDYERGYGERRGLEPPSEIVVARRGRFAGLKLGMGRQTERGVFEGVRLTAGERTPEPAAREGLDRAVERYARAWGDAARMEAEGLPVLEAQKAALRQAGAALEAVRPGAERDLVSALEHQPAVRQAMAELQGAERAARLVAGIAQEGRVRQEPALRAERLVKVWGGLEAELERQGDRDRAARREVAARMAAVAGALKGDPEVEAVLRRRQGELGIAPGSRLDRVLREPNVERAQEQVLRQGRGLRQSL